MEPALAFALNRWKRQSTFTEPGDWVFASPVVAGQTPYWPGTILDRLIRPAAAELGIQKRIGWHTLRRTTATLLVSVGADVKVAQELMRHASPVMTLGTYAQAVSEEKRAAQSRIAVLFKLATEPEDLALSA